MIEAGLYDLLNTNTTFMSTCKGLYLNTIPEKAPTPSLMFKVVAGTFDATADGPSAVVERRYQFTCAGRDKSTAFDSGYVAAKLLQEALRTLIDGLALTTLSDGTYVFNVRRSTELDYFDSDSQVHHCITDYIVQFRQN